MILGCGRLKRSELTCRAAPAAMAGDTRNHLPQSAPEGFPCHLPVSFDVSSSCMPPRPGRLRSPSSPQFPPSPSRLRSGPSARSSCWLRSARAVRPIRCRATWQAVSRSSRTTSRSSSKIARAPAAPSQRPPWRARGRTATRCFSPKSDPTPSRTCSPSSPTIPTPRSRRSSTRSTCRRWCLCARRCPTRRSPSSSPRPSSSRASSTTPPRAWATGRTSSWPISTARRGSSR